MKNMNLDNSIFWIQVDFVFPEKNKEQKSRNLDPSAVGKILENPPENWG